MIVRVIISFLLIITALFGVYFVYLGPNLTDSSIEVDNLFSFSGKQPDHVGINNGQLADCPQTPNCISSESNDVTHQVKPLHYHSSPQQALNQLKQILEDTNNAEIITQKDNYIYAQFTTTMLGFVDDVEFYLEPDSALIHVRSASRIGESDLGVNRRRIERIREQFAS